MSENRTDYETATLANGCFWCSEAVFKRLKGIKSVLPGYSGGQVKNPSYEQVCSGRTGHAESIQIKFDPKVIGFEKVLDIFWRTHDPTTLTGRVTTLGHSTVLQSFIMTRSRKKLLKSRKVQLKTNEPTKLQSLQKLRHTMTFMLQRIITRITTKTIKMLHISILL